MSKISQNNIIQNILKHIPIILLFISVLNEFDFNNLGLIYFSFNFSYILIFYYSLKKSESLGYIYIFIAGLFNDVVTGTPIGGVDVVYNSTNNNLSFTTGSTGDNSTIKIDGAQRFGLKDVPLGIGETALVRTPVQATDELGRPLYVSPTGEITSKFDDFADNIVEDFYPLYLDDGELTFNKAGELTSPITKVKYDGLPNAALTVDFSKATQFAQPFSATEVSQDGFASGRLTNLEIDNYGNVKAGYSNGSNVTLGKIIIANQ